MLVKKSWFFIPHLHSRPPIGIFPSEYYCVWNNWSGINITHRTPPLHQILSTSRRPDDIKSRWRHNWKSAQVVNSHLLCHPTIRQPGFDLPRQQWSLLNRFCTEQGHCGACRRKWWLTDLCPCGEAQAMSHIVESCPLTKLNGGLSRLHSADEDAVSWLTSYGAWHAHEKMITICSIGHCHPDCGVAH